MKHLFSLKSVYAHCDIPCGIYDPHAAQIASLTVLRMLDLMSKSGEMHDLSRYIAVKEEHAEKCKHEIRIIWGDFFAEEDINAEINQLVHRIMKLASMAKQGKDLKLGVELLEAVNHFAELFWAKKDIKTKRVAAPYKVEAEMVVPEL